MTIDLSKRYPWYSWLISLSLAAIAIARPNLYARYFWLIALILSPIAAVTYYRRNLQVYITQCPERAQGYQRFLIGFVVINVLLWSIMGFGILVGGLPNVSAYFHPSSGNPYVLMWHSVTIELWIFGIWWIFFRGGAQFIVDHPGLLNVNVTKPVLIKLGFSVFILLGVLIEILQFSIMQ